MIIRSGTSPKRCIHTVFDGNEQEFYSLVFSLNGRLRDRTSKVLTINDGDSLNNKHGVASVAFSPNGQFVAESLHEIARIWDVNISQLVERLK